VAPVLCTRAVVFCDVAASTELRHRLGDTEADTWFADLFGRIEAALIDADGIVVKWLGDGAMAVFTSAAGALNAAVAMQQGTHAYGRYPGVEPGQLRVGVSIGDVSGTGDDWVGMPVVQAARLCDAARPDEILAADVVRVLAGSRCSHPMSSAGEYELKGIEERLAVARVEWVPAPHATLPKLPSPLDAARRGPFAGRALLVADLYDAWKAGEWRALLVSGEPGIGKTRLVAELAHRVHSSGCAVVLGRCDEELAVAYRPWMEALSALIDSLGNEQLKKSTPEHVGELCRLVPGLAQRVSPPATDVVADADTRHAMIVDAVVALLQIAGPRVVVIDDMHWIDQRSLQLARRVLAADLPDIAIVGTYRDTDLDRFHHLTAALADLRRVSGVRRVGLEGLDGPAVEEFLEQSAGHALDADGLDLAQAVHSRTAGNPLFVGELLRDLADSGADSLALPEGLREVIGRRVASLGTAASRVLQIAAAIGPSFDLDVVEEMVGPDAVEADVLSCLELAQHAGIVTDMGQRFEFRHAVIRDVLLGDLSAVRRQRLHRDLAAVLERRWALSLDRHVDELAYHHGQARTPQAASWYLRAARAAAASLDAGATALADRGLDLLELVQPPDAGLHCDLLIARALGVRLTGVETIDDARVAFDAAVALGDQERIGSALLSVSLRSAVESQDEHLAFLSEGLRYLTDSTRITRWHVEETLVLREFMKADSDPADHRARIAEIVAHLDPANTLDCQIGMRCARSLTSTNQAPDAVPVTERFIANCDGIDTEGFPVEVGLSTMWMHLGDRDLSERYLAIAENDPRRGYWFFDCQVLQRQVMRDLLDGRWSAAAEGITESERIGGHDGNIVLACASQTHWLRRETGELAANEQAIRDFQLTMPDFPVLRGLTVGEVAERGSHDEARAILDELAADDFLGVGRGWLTLLALGNVAWAAIAVGAAQHAGRLRRLLADYRGQIAVMATGTYAMCAVDRLHAGLFALDGEHDEADRLFAGALAQERSLRSRPLETRTLHWWGRALLRRGETERGLELLTRARDFADELGMRAVQRQIDDLTGV
jgi:class 3 adenylate cyclase